MKFKTIFIPCVFFSLFCIFAAGCVATTANRVPPAPVSGGRPDWVTNGSGAFVSRDERVLFGVGAAKGIKNRSISRTVSDNRSREEIGKLLDGYLQRVVDTYKNYASVSEEVSLKQSMQKVNVKSLGKATIVAHWMDPANGSFFSLCRLNVSDVTGNIREEETIDDEIRNFASQYEKEIHQKLMKGQ